MAVSNPVCAKDVLEDVLGEYLANCQATQTIPIFPAICENVAGVLHRLGFSMTMMGIELAMPLAQYKLSKDQRRYMRAASNHGLELRTLCRDREELDQMNAEWLSGKVCKTEVTCITIPPSLPQFETEHDVESANDEVRRVFAYQNDRLVGMLMFEPFYSSDGSEKLQGYTMNGIRVLPKSKPGWITDFMLASLIQTLQAEGEATLLAFGISPLVDLREQEGEIPWVRRLLQAYWNTREDTIYSFHGLHQKKERICAGHSQRLQDKFASVRQSRALLDTLRMTLLVGLDLSEGAKGRWLWAWAWDEVHRTVRRIMSCSFQGGMAQQDRCATSRPTSADTEPLCSAMV